MKPASLLAAPLGKALSGISPPWCGKQMAGIRRPWALEKVWVITATSVIRYITRCIGIEVVHEDVVRQDFMKTCTRSCTLLSMC